MSSPGGGNHPAELNNAEHWDAVYTTKDADEVSWFQAEPTTSLALLQQWAPARTSVVDIGAGSSTLVDRMLNAGFDDITVLDVSATALDGVRARLGNRSSSVTFVTADVTSWKPARSYGAWHDRAVFHFLVEHEQRDRSVALATKVVAPGGVIVLATFAEDGPTQCSGLPTRRYGAEQLADASDRVSN